MWADPSQIDLSLDSRAITFENPDGGRGAGGAAHGGRKGAPSRTIAAGERVTLADIEGPGTIRHIWFTVPPAPPEVMRAFTIAVFYDDLDRPSISVPLLDFFGLPHGRPVPYASQLTVAAEGRGFNAYFPMPFRTRIRVEFTNASARSIDMYFQLDYTLGPVAGDAGLLHAAFRRQNPTALRDDFVISDGFHGPGRFLGCVVGIRPIDGGWWYGEGEVKVFRDGDGALPTICGTGLEDYVGSAWGMGPHAGPYAGAPLDVRAADANPMVIPDFLSLYRWHVPDPIVFRDDLRVTIQQIGMTLFLEGQEELMARYLETNPPAGRGWTSNPRPGVAGMGICERVDDYCAADFVYCRDPQPVAPLDVGTATADIERKDYESASVFETLLQ